MGGGMVVVLVLVAMGGLTIPVIYAPRIVYVIPVWMQHTSKTCKQILIEYLAHVLKSIGDFLTCRSAMPDQPTRKLRQDHSMPKPHQVH